MLFMTCRFNRGSCAGVKYLPDLNTTVANRPPCTIVESRYKAHLFPICSRIQKDPKAKC